MERAEMQRRVERHLTRTAVKRAHAFGGKEEDATRRNVKAVVEKARLFESPFERAAVFKKDPPEDPDLLPMWFRNGGIATMLLNEDEAARSFRRLVAELEILARLKPTELGYILASLADVN